MASIITFTAIILLFCFAEIGQSLVCYGGYTITYPNRTTKLQNSFVSCNDAEPRCLRVEPSVRSSADGSILPFYATTCANEGVCQNFTCSTYLAEFAGPGNLLNYEDYVVECGDAMCCSTNNCNKYSIDELKRMRQSTTMETNTKNMNTDDPRLGAGSVIQNAFTILLLTLSSIGVIFYV